jgi:hypothetical protein
MIWCCAFPVNQARFSIQPSTIFVEPNQVYTSKISLASDSLPKEFFSGVNYPDGSSAHYSARLKINARLDDNSTQYADDEVVLTSRFGGPMSWDTLSTDNCSISINRGEKKQINIFYLYNPDAGLGEVNFTASATPLNASITPSEFIVKHTIEFPAVLTISAGSSLPPGEYPVEILINGNHPSQIHCKDSNTFQPLMSNVTVV